MKFKTEAELAKVVSAYLQEQGWTLYFEVECMGSIADIVAVIEPHIWVIECKRSCSLDLWDQAIHWLPHANMVSVAYPRQKTCKSSAALAYIQRTFGIGQILARPAGVDSHVCEDPVLRRKRTKYLQDALTGEQQVFAEPGNAAGRRWTPFKATCRNLYHYVKKNDGVCFSDALKAIQHHYSSSSSARHCLSSLLREGVVKGVEVEKKSGRLLLHATDEGEKEYRGV